jgi:general secretion pathway protein I
MKVNAIRRGFSLIEVAIALAISAGGMVWTYSLISNALTLQRKALTLSNAVLLAKIKMSQIDASSKLESDTSSGDIPGYKGYKFETIIKEDQIDLLKLAKGESEESKGKKPEDLLGKSGGAGMSDLLKKRGMTQTESETGGTVKVLKITVSITYPDGNTESVYKTETFRSLGGFGG